MRYEYAIGKKRLRLLSENRLAVPTHWKRSIQLAEQLGLQIQCVRPQVMGRIDTGKSPGGTVYLKQVCYISKNIEIEFVRHEIFHFLVAKNQGKELRFNFGSNRKDELLACDVQISWALANLGVHRAVKEAADVNFHWNDGNGSVTPAETFKAGQKELTLAGIDIEIPQLKQEKFASAWGVASPDSRWNEHSKRERASGRRK